MDTLQRIRVDFNSLTGGRVALNKLCSRKDLEQQGIQLQEGLELEVYDVDPSEEHPDDELQAQGYAHYDEKEKRWVLVLTSRLTHISDSRTEHQIGKQ